MCWDAKTAHREAEAGCQEDNRWRWRVKKMRGGGGITTGVTQQPAGKQEANGGGGICRQEAVDCQEDKKLQRCNERRCDNQPESPADKRWRCH